MISLLKDLDNPCHKLKKRIKGVIEFKIKEGQQSTSPLRDEEKSSHFVVLCYKCQVHSKSENCYQILFNAMCLVTVKAFFF